MTYPQPWKQLPSNAPLLADEAKSNAAKPAAIRPAIFVLVIFGLVLVTSALV